VRRIAAVEAGNHGLPSAKTIFITKILHSSNLKQELVRASKCGIARSPENRLGVGLLKVRKAHGTRSETDLSIYKEMFVMRRSRCAFRFRLQQLYHIETAVPLYVHALVLAICAGNTIRPAIETING